MSQYQLNVVISKEDMITMKGMNQKVAIVKESDDSNHNLALKASNGNLDVVTWVAFKPFMQGKVTWEENYSVYASDSEFQNGATIDKMSEEPAIAGIRKYVFEEGIFTEEHYSGEIKPAYYIHNKYADLKKLTFGLAQSVQVTGNGTYVSNPVNAMEVMYNHEAYFIPVVRLKIFLSASAENGKVISVSQSQTLSVDFTDKLQHTVQYDSAAGAFVLVD